MIGRVITVFGTLMSGKVAAEAAADLNEVAIGIDLGTTYSLAAAVVHGSLRFIETTSGARALPSWVAFHDGQIAVGAEAKRILDPTTTIYEVKRLIGRKFTDSQIVEERKKLTYKIAANTTDRQGGIDIVIPTKDGEKRYSPEAISALILQKLKNAASEQYGAPVGEAIITVPAYFNDSQRESTKLAGKIAGLNVVKILNEPTAAAINYGLHKEGMEETILVFDLGGGTFDISVVTIEGEVFETLATDGDSHLGGEDFDNAILQYVVEEHRKSTGYDINANNVMKRMLKAECEKAKRELSTSTQTIIALTYEDIEVYVELSRAQFRTLVTPLINRCIDIMKRVMASDDVFNVEKIILVGGQTRMPAIVDAVKEASGIEPCALAVNPDLAVAAGAAYHVAVLSGQTDGDMVLLDVTPMTFGIETVGGVMAVLIPKNSPVPATKTRVFSTNADNQTSVLIQVYEGERPNTQHNNRLGRFELSGIAPAPRGVPQIEVTFSVNTDGILSVSAIDKASSKKEHIEINSDTWKMSDEQIEAHMKEAEANAAADLLFTQRVEARNRLDNYLFGVTKFVQDNSEGTSRLGETEITTVKGILNSAKDWLIANDDATAEVIDAKREEVEAELAPYFNQSGGDAPGDDDDDPYDL